MHFLSPEFQRVTGAILVPTARLEHEAVSIHDTSFPAEITPYSNLGFERLPGGTAKRAYLENREQKRRQALLHKKRRGQLVWISSNYTSFGDMVEAAVEHPDCRILQLPGGVTEDGAGRDYFEPLVEEDVMACFCELKKTGEIFGVVYRQTPIFSTVDFSIIED
jgi:hypothetical protein